MCDACGCTNTIIGDVTGHTSGKPQDPHGQYDGVGGSK
jgi:hypothetical protein